MFVAITSDRELQVHPREVDLGHDVLWVLDVKDLANLFLGSPRGGGCQADDARRVAQLFFDHIVEDEVGGSEVV